MEKIMDKKKILTVIALPMLFLTLAQPVHAGMASASYEVNTSVISGGGGRANSTSYSLTEVIGQPTPLLTTAPTAVSASYDLAPGFLHTLAGGACGFDREPDGDIDGLDLAGLAAAGPQTGEVSAFAAAFGRNDCPRQAEEPY
jgi:hypothetical protein